MCIRDSPDPAPGPATPQNEGIGNMNFMLGKSVKPYPDLVVVSSNALSIKGNILQAGDIEQTGNINQTGRFTTTGKVTCGSLSSGLPKSFDIEHPTKGKGWRLRYACIEGPEAGVYYRGRLKNEKVIRLPYYWKDLVSVDSITVQLQPIGAHQDIIVKRWDDEYIYLQAQGGLPINCFYHVYAERKDVAKLIIEYEGESIDDYPG